MQGVVLCSVVSLVFFFLLTGASVFFLVHCMMEKPEDVFGRGVTHPQSIAVGGSRIFLVDRVDERIVSANLDGGDIGELQTSGSLNPHSVAVDTVAGKIYWTDATAGKVLRASYNGLDIEDVARNLDGPAGIAVHPGEVNGVVSTAVVWGCRGSRKIQTASVPSTSIGAFLPAVSDLATAGAADDVFGVALDAVGGYVYWTLSASKKIQRAPMDGSGSARDLVTGLETPEGIAVDSAAELVYWSDPGAGTISRASVGASVAGANQEVVVASAEEPRGLALDVGNGKLYFGESSAQVVRRSNINGECLLYKALGTEVVVTAILGAALSLAVCGCCVACGLLARSGKSSLKSPPPATDSTPADAPKAEGDPPPDTEKGTEQSPPPPAQDEEQTPPAADTEAADQEVAPVHADEEEELRGLQIMAELPGEASSEGKDVKIKAKTEPDPVVPEFENPRKSGGLCFFCAA